MPEPINARVLVVDDEESVRAAFREILCPPRRDESALDDVAAELFGEGRSGGETEPRYSVFRFEVDEARNGREAVSKVRGAVEEGRPYAVIFVDVRMPGWDGLETVLRLREIDKRAEVIFVTAYSDHSIEEIVQKAGANVGYQNKPFDADVVRQIATKAVYEWNKTSALEALIRVIGELEADGQRLEPLLSNVLHQVAELAGSRSAMVVREGEAGAYEPVVTIGQMADDEATRAALATISGQTFEEVGQSGDLVVCPLRRFGIVVARPEGDRTLDSERLYLLRLFIEHAAQALENADLHEELLRREKLSAIGSAIGMVAHDLRGPLGNIKSLLEIAREASDDGDTLREMHALAMHSADEAMHLVEDILDFVRRKPVNAEPTEAQHVAEELERACRDLAQERGAEIRVEVEPELVLRADRRKLLRVLWNLVRNGVESQADAERPFVQVTFGSAGGRAVLDVEDRGGGVPQELRQKLFEPFVTAGKSGGTGLGLAIARQVVEAHGGEIGLAASDEGGSTFRITLPLAMQDEPSRAAGDR